MKISEILRLILKKNLTKWIKEKELNDLNEHHYRVYKAHHEHTVNNLKEFNKLLKA
jgi:hypothetical protein